MRWDSQKDEAPGQLALSCVSRRTFDTSKLSPSTHHDGYPGVHDTTP